MPSAAALVVARDYPTLAFDGCLQHNEIIFNAGRTLGVGKKYANVRIMDIPDSYYGFILMNEATKATHEATKATHKALIEYRRFIDGLQPDTRSRVLTYFSMRYAIGTT